MKYKLVMSDEVRDETLTMTLEADDVFDAINKTTRLLDHPNETKLITAYPIDLMIDSIAKTSAKIYRENKSWQA